MSSPTKLCDLNLKKENNSDPKTEEANLNLNFKEKLKLNEDSRLAKEKEAEREKEFTENQIDLITTIEYGHDAFMKALKTRYRNLQSISAMWNSGNIKSALDHATNLNDVGLMADILNEINLNSNVWNLDVCTILLPSIKNVINSKYEEYGIS